MFYYTVVCFNSSWYTGTVPPEIAQTTKVKGKVLHKTASTSDTSCKSQEATLTAE